MTKIMVFGTFDYLHPGHINLFKQARRLARDPYLVVSIARDLNVKRIKGKPALNTEKDRKSLVESCKLVDEVILGSSQDYLKHIVKQKPQIIALGYDQKAYTENLQPELEKLGLRVIIKRLKRYGSYATSKMKLT